MGTIRVERVDKVTKYQFGPVDKDHDPVLEFTTDSTYGLYISKLTVDGEQIKFRPDYLLRIKLRGGTTLNASNWTLSHSSDASGIVTITATGTGSYAGLNTTITLTPKYAGYIYAISVSNTTSSKVDLVEFPRLKPEPPSGDMTNTAVLSPGFGYIITSPHKDTVGRTEGESAYTLPYTGWYDSSSGHFITLWTVDSASYQTLFSVLGDGTYASFWVSHRPPNSRVAGNDFTQPYSGYFDLGVDPRPSRTTFWKICERYKDWSVQSGLPWTVTKWYNNSAVSNRVKTCYWNISNYREKPTYVITDAKTDIDRINTFFSLSGSNRGLYRYMNWATNKLSYTDYNPDPGAVDANYEASLLHTGTGAQSVGWHQYPYTLPTTWDATLLNALGYAGAYKLDLFDSGSGAESLIPYICYDESTVPISGTGDLVGHAYVFDDVSSYSVKWSAVRTAVYNLYWALFATHKPRGWYLDTMGGLRNLNFLTSINPNGNIGALQSGAKAVAAAIKSARTGSDPDFFTVTEQSNEALVGTIDIHNLADYDTSYPFAFMANITFGEYQRITSLGAGTSSFSDDAFGYITVNLVMYYWVHSGYISLSYPVFGPANIMSAGQSVDTASAIDVYPSSTAWYYPLTVLLGMSDFTPLVIEAFRGRLMRPLENSWWETYAAPANGVATSVGYIFNGHHIGKLWESVWKDLSGNIYLMFGNGNVNTSSSRFPLNYTPAITRSFTFRSGDYEMSRDTLKTVQLITTAGTTTLGTFTDTYAGSVTVYPAKCAAIKITETH